MQEITHITQKTLHFIKWGALIACVGFLGHQIYRFAPAVSEALKEESTLAMLPSWALGYALLLVLLAVSWHLLLSRLHGTPLSFKLSLYAYTRSSIAKYLPGNAGHLIGRNLFAKRLGVRHVTIAKSTLLEILVQISAACAIAVWADVPFWGTISPQMGLFVSFALLCLAPTVILFSGKWHDLPSPQGRLLTGYYGTLLCVSVLSMIFFASTGIIFSKIIETTAPGLPLDFMAIISIYAISWFAGLVMPGAPAGLGVRETIMISMLSQTIEGAQALVIAVLFRIVTTLGDLFFFSISFTPWLTANNEKQ